SGSIIILYLFSIISTCYYTPRLECQPCQEPKMSTMYGSSTAKGTEPKIFEFIEDSVDSQRPNKTLHRWTQSIDEAMHVISKLTRENETVLDPMMGTGTTGMAALNQNRRFIGIEKNADTFRLARHRISKIISSKQNSPTGEELPS
ncbi:MAG: DNA methyltransferase, partial [Candidatus Nitrosopolaris sp.]